jgi:SAM-dependent methyltransferase
LPGTNRDTGYSLENARDFGWGSGDLTHERRELLDKHVTGATVLDAGCGVGGFVEYLNRRGFATTGIEKHEMFLVEGRQKGFRGNFVRGDLSRPLPFRDKTFDTTICLDVLEHVDNDVGAVRELARVTRKRLVIAVPQEDKWMTPYGLVFSPYRDPTHLRYYTPEALGELVRGSWASHVTVFGEYPIKFQKLALDFLEPRASGPGLSNVYRKLFRFLVNQTGAPTLFMNLVAIVDLHATTP